MIGAETSQSARNQGRVLVSGQKNLRSVFLDEMIGQVWTSSSRTSSVTCRESSRDKDSIQEAAGALGSFVALKPGPAGTLSHEQ